MTIQYRSGLLRCLIILCFFNLLCTSVRAQIDVTYTISNPRPSDDGLAYEVDVLISTTTPFKFGSGQLYFNYNRQTFGENVAANGRVEVLRPPGSILATTVGFPVYQTPIVNDNTNSRVSIAYLQGTSSGCLPGPNVTATPSLLFTLRLVFEPGQSGSDPNVCFEQQDLFVNQTFTACGSDAGCGFPDCQNSPGRQISDDFYQCSTALPVELVAFTAVRQKADAHLNWETVREVDGSHFVVEKSPDGVSWTDIATVVAVGESRRSHSYSFTETDFATGIPQALYRLRMVDLDGSYTYSNIRQLQAHGREASSLQVYPNPAHHGFNVQLPATSRETLDLRLYASDGKLVSSRAFPAGTASARYFNLSGLGLAPGLYLLRAADGASVRVVLR